MWFKMSFKFLADKKKHEILKENGIMLGTRRKSDRTVFLYMVKDFFVEVTYRQDDIDQEPERIETFSNLDNLTSYLERDFRAAF